MADSETKVTLHWLNGSRAQGTMWLLEELQVPYELDVHHRLPTGFAPPEADKLHILGKFPIVSISGGGQEKPLVLAESAFIIQYLSEHFTHARNLVPRRWRDGQEGKIGGETEAWMRYQYLLYYMEGSFMFPQLIYFFMDALATRPPFFIRPLTRFIANQVTALLVMPNMKRHLAMLENYLETSPDGGSYLCGAELTGADILFAYPLMAAMHMDAYDKMGRWEKGSFRDTFPKLHAYIGRLGEEPGWKRAVEKVKEAEGGFSILPEN
ncbi:hypothetical protein QBC47DRAFT_393546 [Echria macrotheca]|uniref:Glutathione transferase n=1 Tax=Echria macrotheca TaxID=438768 RepID=A0AAJ0B5I7_9PEZI|nr:hypothetical protein QBC47DRAFT_393546 [Echria macrotheca]